MRFPSQPVTSQVAAGAMERRLGRAAAWVLALTLLVPALRAQKAAPGRAETAAQYLAGANAAMAKNDSPRAIAIFQQGLTAHPGWREGWWDLGSLFYEAHQYDPARSAFAHLTQLDPNAGAAWVMLGLCDFEMRDYGLSLEHLVKGRALGFPKNPELSDAARYHQALLLIAAGHFEPAYLLLGGFAAENHPSDSVKVAFGLDALQMPLLPDQAEEILSDDQLALVRSLGEAEWQASARSNDVADTDFQAVVAKYPSVRWVHYAYGIWLASMGRLDRAAAMFHREIALNPTSVLARLQLAGMAMTQGHPAQGIPMAREAVAMAPDLGAAHYLLGQCLTLSGELAEGTKELERARDLSPDSSEIRYALAQAYIKDHRRADARREQQAFLKLKPIEDSMLYKGVLPSTLFLPGKKK